MFLKYLASIFCLAYQSHFEDREIDLEGNYMICWWRLDHPRAVHPSQSGTLPLTLDCGISSLLPTIEVEITQS